MPPLGKRALFKSMQQCYEQERCALLVDLENMRKQSLKKDQDAQKLASINSQHTLQLKKEIASWQKSLASITKEREELRDKYSHTSSLLETAIDQHEKDKHLIAELMERKRSTTQGHQESLEMVKHQNALPVKEAYRERSRLLERIDNLRLQLDKERKELHHVRSTLSDKLEKSELRVKVLDKQISECQTREKNSFRVKEKAVREASEYKRKLLMSSDGTKNALQSNQEMQTRHMQVVLEFQEALYHEVCTHRQTIECQQMCQEECSIYFRAYSHAKQQNAQYLESIEELQHQHEYTLCSKNERITELENKLGKNLMTCRRCSNSPEQCEIDDKMRLNQARDEIRLQVQKELQQENLIQYQEVIDKYVNMCQQLQTLSNDFDGLISEKNALTTELEWRIKQEDYFLQQLVQSEQRYRDTLEGHCDQEKTLQSLLLKVDSLTSLTQAQIQQIRKLENENSLTVGQSQESVHELEVERDAIRVEKEAFQREIHVLKCELEALSTERDSIRSEKEAAETREITLRCELEALLAERDSLMAEKKRVEMTHQHEIEKYEVAQEPNLRRTKELTDAQQSSNFLLEEQKQTINHLLEAKDLLVQQVAVAKEAIVADTLSSAKHRAQKIHNVHEPSVSQWNERLMKLRQKYKKRIAILKKQLNTIEMRNKELEQLLHEQAQTIHELTLQEDDSEFSDDPIEIALSDGRDSSAYPFSYSD